ncbi:MAG TPA: hypothetical protein ENJ31_11740 [Anaerolineae bacterium]|nr:hypothetical protein [Anaerolineae bacterium]
MHERRRGRLWDGAALLLLLLTTLTPRLVALGSLTNPDELKWLDRSVTLYDAVARGDWAATLQAFHPGITPSWGFGALLCARYGLDRLRAWQAADALPMADLAHTALWFPVLLSAATVLAVYLLLRRLAGREAAFLAALLLAVEPYYLAFTHAIHLDLTQASLMVIAALLWLNYLHSRRWPFWAGSGFVAGLALLTRTAALYLVPFSLLAGGVYFVADNWRGDGLRPTPGWGRQLGRIAPAWAGWLLTLILTLFALWPALWVEPLATLGRLTMGVLRSVENPHAAPVFFLGQVTTADPGLLYYLLILLFRLRPLTLALSLLNPLLLGLAWRRLTARLRAAWLLGLAYVLFYFIQMALAPHKLERYLLPLVPALDILAGVSLALIVRRLSRPLAARMGRGARAARAPVRTALVGAAILLLAWPWLRLAPYFWAYFNPLAGGGSAAVRLFTVGGGEGLDRAAAYLNAKPGIEEQWALSFYAHLFRHYFHGRTRPSTWGSWAGLPVAAHYVVITQGQAQRDIYPTVLDFFRPRQPEYTVRIGDVDYAWVYAVPRRELDAPPSIQHPLEANFEHRVHLLGYDLEPVEGALQLTLYWKLITPVHEETRVSIRLVDKGGQTIASVREPPWSGDVAVLSWPGGLAVRDVHALPLPDDLAPGRYDLVLSLEQRLEDGQERRVPLADSGATELRLGPVELPLP